ncbi:hypothetical protein OIT41_02630 [Arthrobacter sp. YA7-1]|uniref:hypothetical protein n=1 Tax=Arthrobacter sp. YA7-1 TaxID=2987701 RepID=UPI002227711F|nr:hypothetical protein [Arthrobacter sp. YA7-1]UYY83356.1 hypothetical protein OIT41_02630 [Arthrobacter sp. YA7-1]
MLRLPRQATTVGLLICGSQNEHTVRYALDSSAQPLMVTSYTYEALPRRRTSSTAFACRNRCRSGTRF